MKKNNKIRTVLLCVYIFCMAAHSHGQMQEGKIVFERKTNLFKKFTEKSTRDYIKEENKYKKKQNCFCHALSKFQEAMFPHLPCPET